MIPSRPPPTLPRAGGWSPAFNDFVKRCLEKDTAARPTAEELLAVRVHTPPTPFPGAGPLAPRVDARARVRV